MTEIDQFKRLRRWLADDSDGRGYEIFEGKGDHRDEVVCALLSRRETGDGRYGFSVLALATDRDSTAEAVRRALDRWHEDRGITERPA